MVFFQRREESEKSRENEEKVAREAIAIVGNFLLNEEGILLRKKREEKLPEIRVGLPPVYGGEKIAGENMRISLQLLKELKERSLTVQFVEIYNEKLMMLVLEDKTRVFYNSLLEAREMAFSLETILSSFRIEGKKVSEIDFRFGKPVVRF